MLEVMFRDASELEEQFDEDEGGEAVKLAAGAGGEQLGAECQVGIRGQVVARLGHHDKTSSGQIRYRVGLDVKQRRDVIARAAGKKVTVQGEDLAAVSEAEVRGAAVLLHGGGG